MAAVPTAVDGGTVQVQPATANSWNRRAEVPLTDSLRCEPAGTAEAHKDRGVPARHRKRSDVSVSVVSSTTDHVGRAQRAIPTVTRANRTVVAATPISLATRIYFYRLRTVTGTNILCKLFKVITAVRHEFAGLNSKVKFACF